MCSRRVEWSPAALMAAATTNVIDANNKALSTTSSTSSPYGGLDDYHGDYDCNKEEEEECPP